MESLETTSRWFHPPHKIHVTDFLGDIGDIENGVAVTSTTSTASAKKKEAYVPLSPSKSNRQAKSFDIAWSGLSFVVKDTTILSNCYGSVPSGSVCAIMGPSGAGKSSLLNVLAGRSASAPGIKVSGTVTVGGEIINPQRFRRNIAYVMQDDALMPTATPREALRFSASLRLPASTPKDTIEKLVSKTIVDLGLENCADVLIGGALIKGISGGQRKRTSVGVEIITDPVLLFLDEPTSGLDSYSAYNCVQLLKKIALKNAVVLCTIHQPSSEVFQLFDMCIFMVDGRIFYQGPVRKVISFFQQFGYQCPVNYNPSDYVMYLAQTETMDQIEASGIMLSNQKDADALEQQHFNAPKLGEKNYPSLSSPIKDCLTTTAAVKEDQVSLEEAEEEDSDFVVVRSSFLRQLSFLVHRDFNNTIRDIGSLSGRFGITIVLNLIFGLIFFNAGNKDDSDPENFNGHFGAVTMIAISSMFGPAQPVMLAFPFERLLFMREYSTGTYGPMAYFISKISMELPLTFIQCVVQFILVYFTVALRGNFIYIVLISWALGAAGCSVAVVLGCVLTDVKGVSEMAPLLFVPQLLFAGFFIRTSLIPVFLRWAQYLCSLKYAINLIILEEFDPALKSCSGAAALNCKKIVEHNEIDPDKWWVYMLLLILLFVGFRLLAAAILVKKAQRFY